MPNESTNVPITHPAQVARLEAEAAKFHAEELNQLALASYNGALARKYTAEAQYAEIELGNKARVETSLLSQDYFHRVINFNTPFRDVSVEKAIALLSEWHRVDPGCAIEIVINSPGGSVIDGMAMFDYLTYLRVAGHHVTTRALGMAASMAGILLQAGDHRIMGAQCYMLIHEVAFGAGGKIGEVEDTVELSKKMQKRILDILAERSSLTAKMIDNRWKRKDWWLDSDEALQLGFVDEIA